MSLKDIAYLLKAMPKRMIVIIAILIITLVSIIVEVGIKAFIGLLIIAVLGFVIAKISYRDY